MKKAFLFITILAIYSINIVFAQGPAILYQLGFGGNGADRLQTMVLVASQYMSIPFVEIFLAGTTEGTSDDYWLLKYNETNDQIEWENSFGGDDSDELQGLGSPFSALDAFLVAVGNSYSGKTGDKTEESRGESDIWIAQVDEEGNFLGDKSFGGGGYDYASSFYSTADGGYVIGATSDSPISGDKTEESRGESDYWIIKNGGTGKIGGVGNISSIVNVEWNKTIGGQGIEQLSSILQTQDGGYILGGTSNSPISGDKTEESKGAGDFWIVWLNEEGNLIRDKTIGGSKNDNFVAMVPTTDGGYILGGTSNSPISGDKTEDCYLSWYDYWVVKIDNLGNKIWDKTFGGTGYDRLFSMIPTPDGGYLLGGESDSPISGDKSESCRGERDYWVLKIDKWGNKIWDKTIGGSGYDRLRSMAITEDLGIYLAGYSNSPISGDFTEQSNGDYDFWLVKLEGDTPLDIEETQLTSIVEEFTVLPAYPNPFNPSTTISYGLKNNSHITVEIYDISGKLISTLINQNQTQGWHSVVWNGTNQIGELVANGQYLSKITSGEEIKTTKLMLLK